MTEKEQQRVIKQRLGLDPGTLGLKGTYHRLSYVGFVAHVYCFQ
jgi:hypothetical protein